METTLETNFFLINLQGSCGGPKRVIIFTCTGWPHGKEINFIFGLVYKVVMEVQSFFYSFHLHGCSICIKN
jgi:hypothetical protein